jgi:hypothetical protein
MRKNDKVVRFQEREKPLEQLLKSEVPPATPDFTQLLVKLLIGTSEWEPVGYKFLRDVGFRDFREMLRDPVISSCLELKTYLPLRHGVKVTPKDGSEEAKALADVVQWMLDTTFENGIDHVLRSALDAVGVGFSVQEVFWEKRNYRGQEFWCPVYTVAIDPSLVGFEVDEWWRVKRILVYTKGFKEKPLPLERAIYWRYKPTYDHPYGHGDLWEAWRAWFIKKNVLRLWLVFAERVAMQTRVVKYPRGMTPEAVEDLWQKLEQKVAQLTVLVPSDIELEVIEASKSPSEIFESLAHWANIEMARAILGSSLAVDEGQRVGSLAMAKVHLDVAFSFAKTMASEVERSIVKKQIVDRFLRVNFGEEALEIAPDVMLPQPDPGEMAMRAKVIMDAVDRGVVAPDEEWVRTELDFPPPPKAEYDELEVPEKSEPPEN